MEIADEHIIAVGDEWTITAASASFYAMMRNVTLADVERGEVTMYDVVAKWSEKEILCRAPAGASVKVGAAPDNHSQRHIASRWSEAPGQWINCHVQDLPFKTTDAVVRVIHWKRVTDMRTIARARSHGVDSELDQVSPQGRSQRPMLIQVNEHPSDYESEFRRSHDETELSHRGGSPLISTLDGPAIIRVGSERAMTEMSVNSTSASPTRGGRADSDIANADNIVPFQQPEISPQHRHPADARDSVNARESQRERLSKFAHSVGSFASSSRSRKQVQRLRKLMLGPQQMVPELSWLKRMGYMISART